MKKTVWTLLLVLAVCVCVVALVACNKDTEPEHIAPVNAATVAYDGDTLTWAAVEHAECYWVYLNDSAEYYAVPSTSFSLRLSEDVTFSILAVANNASYISAESKAVVKFNYMPTVASIGVEKRTTDKIIGDTFSSKESSFDHFTWNAVEGAESYLLIENGGQPVSYQPKNNSGVLKQPIGASFDSKGGVATLSIKPVSADAHTYSHWSEERKVTVLADPSAFSFNPDADLITWANVENTVVYQLRIGAVETLANEQWAEASANHYVFGKNMDEFAMEVKAVGNIEKDILDSRLVNRTFKSLPSLSNLAVKYGELRWDPVAGVDSYQVKVTRSIVTGTGEDMTVSVETKLDTVVSGNYVREDMTVYCEVYGKEKENGIEKDKPYSYTAYVRPVVDSVETEAEDVVTFSNWSETPFSLLGTPEVDYDGNQTISWNEVPAAVAYLVTVTHNGTIVKEETPNASTRTYTYDYNDISGTYQVRVAALSSNETALRGVNSSLRSDPLTFVVIAAPAEYTILNNNYIASVESNLSGKDIYDEGKVVSSGDAMTIFFNDVYGANYYVAAHTYMYKFDDVNGDGKPDTEGDGVSNGTELKTTTLNANKLVGDEKYNYSYNVNTTIADGQGRTDTLYLFAKSTFNNQKVSWDANEHKFVADENGRTVILDGDQSTPVQVIKLAAPNISLSGNKISWSNVPRASGYVAVCVSDTDPENTIVVDNIFNNYFTLELLSEGHYTIYVRALGNNDIMMDSVFSNPINVIKLPEVTNVRVERDVDTGATLLKWDYRTFRYADEDYNPLGYKVVVGNRVISNGTVNKNSLDLENLLDYFTSTSGIACYVIAKGNSLNQGSSDMFLLDAAASEHITVFKLARPVALTINAASLAWSAGDTNAQAFKLYNNDVYLGTVSNTSFALTPESLQITEDGKQKTLNLRVRALRNNYLKGERSYFLDSDDSVTLSVSILATPKVSVDQNTGEATWEAVQGASSYLVKVTDTKEDGATYNYSIHADANKSEFSFSPVILTGDKSTVRISISAMGNNIDYINSFDFAYTTAVKKLEAVKTDLEGNAFTITVDKDSETNIPVGFTVHIADAGVTKGQGYYVNIGGKDNFVKRAEDASFTVTSITPGTYEIKVCAVGGNYEGEVNLAEESNTVYINSDYSESKSIYVLAAPMARSVEFSTGGLGDVSKRLICFPVVEQAASYTLTYTFRAVKTPNEREELIEYETIGTPHVITLAANETLANAYIDNQDKENKVCFVIDGITNDVDNVSISIQVNGDNVTSLCNQTVDASYIVH